MGTDTCRIERDKLVRELRRQGLRDTRVLDAMACIRREKFVPPEMQKVAYRNAPLPIGNEQTISQPYIVALMAELLDLDSTARVLDVGTGSGYAAAVLSMLCAEVYSIERFEDLAVSAKSRLAAEGCDNVTVRHGNGADGWPEQAPFDAIAVAAAAPEASSPLMEQLAIGGHLVIPLGQFESQKLVRITRVGQNQFDEQEIVGVRFVPLVDT